MTSKDSLKPRRKFLPLLHEILWTARRYWWVAFIGILLFFALTFVGIRLEGNQSDCFSLIMRDSEVALRIAGVAYGIFAAFCMFRFLWSRRESMLYLSVGAARWKQFILRYVFGFVSVALGVVIPFLITYRSEMATIAEDYFGILSHYTFVYVFSLTVLALLSYTVGVLVAVLCGHFLSALLTATGVLAAPYALLWGIQQMLRFYLFGTPLGVSLLEDHLGAGLFTMLEEQLSYMEYSVYLLERYASMAGADGLAMAEIVKAQTVFPAVRMVLLLVLMAALALLAGFAYCRRPTENAGKATVHPVLSHAVALANGLCVAALVLTVKAPAEGVLGTVILTALFVLTLALAAALIRLILIRDLKGVVKHYPIPCGAGVTCLVLAILLGTGWFGYASYTPDPGDVESVVVSYNQNPVLLGKQNGSGYSMGLPVKDKIGQSSVGFSQGDISYRFLYLYGFTPRFESLPILTDPADVATALSIHEAILADGRQTYTGRAASVHGETVVPVFYRITYKLKNGKSVERYYEYLSLSALEKTVEVENTLAYRSEIADVHDDVGFTDTAPFSFGDPLFGNFTSVNLTEEEQAALMTALDTDMALMSMNERYFGTGAPLKDEVLGIIRVKSMSATSKPSTHPYDRVYQTFYVTAAYENTLAFLEEKGLLSCFEAHYTVTEVRTQRYTPRFSHTADPEATSFVFFSCDGLIQLDLADPEHASAAEYEQLIRDCTASVPEAEWDAYIQSSRAVALMTRPGYMVQIKLTNEKGEEKLVTRYLYDTDLPTRN